MQIRILELANMLNGKIVGDYDSDLRLSGTSSIDGYIDKRITFARSMKYCDYISGLDHAVIVAPKNLEPMCKMHPQNTYIIVDNVEDSIADVQEFFYKEPRKVAATHISPMASVARSAKIGERVYIGENAHIGEHVVIGDGSKVMPGAYIDDDVTIGKRTTIRPFVTCESCVIGDDTIIRMGTHVGDEGFRYVQDIKRKAVRRVIHSGSVVIGDRVIVGANTTIQRSTFEGKPTLVGDDVKMASLIVVSHNVTIGARSVIISQTMIGGSTSVGEDVWIGMGAMISQGLRIGNRAKVLINAVVVNDVPEDGMVSGFYAMPHWQWKMAYERLSQLEVEL